MSYQSWSVVFGEQPSAAKWNILGTNDAAFNNGTGIPSGDAESAYVATSQSTSSTSYTDLATAGPAATAVVGTTGFLFVGVTCKTTPDTSAGTSFMGIALSGANTLAAADKYAVEFRRDANATLAMWGGSWLITGLTPGSTTVTAKYKVGANNASFEHRHVFAIPL